MDANTECPFFANRQMHFLAVKSESPDVILAWKGADAARQLQLKQSRKDLRRGELRLS